MSATISKTTLAFLSRLSRHNNRDWFNTHNNEYESAKQNVEAFVNSLIAKMNEHDQLETTSAKQSLYRIYNDVRFSTDKTPYNPRFAGYLRRVKPFLRGGYYYWITPGNSRIGCGFVYPNSADLQRIRGDIDLNFVDWKTLLRRKSIVSHFGQMDGDRVKTAPRGFSKEHPAIDLLRLKQFWFEKNFTDNDVLSADFLKNLNNSYKAIRPFFDYMSDILTADANGEPLR